MQNRSEEELKELMSCAWAPSPPAHGDRWPEVPWCGSKGGWGLVATESLPEQSVWDSSDVRTKSSQGKTPSTHADFVGLSQACPHLHKLLSQSHCRSQEQDLYSLCLPVELQEKNPSTVQLPACICRIPQGQEELTGCFASH